uniref:SJCHGC09836 protein n=1 Tax=Schistosoma japonicum TaxID=6182 RepID=Q5BQR5_SCHJA|nr:SJCHGC09836 protein [Schistosoma japonicum]
MIIPSAVSEAYQPLSDLAFGGESVTCHIERMCCLVCPGISVTKYKDSRKNYLKGILSIKFCRIVQIGQNQENKYPRNTKRSI